MIEKFPLFLHETGALKFGTFTLKSGRIAPYFVNIDIAADTGSKLRNLSDYYARAIYNDVPVSSNVYLFGPAYKGIPLASSIAYSLHYLYNLDSKWGYNRKEVKDYGDKKADNTLHNLEDGDKVLIVDDVVTDAGTKLDAVNFINSQNKDVEIIGVLVGVDREETTEDDRKKLNIPIYSVTKITTMLHTLLAKNIITQDIYETCESYRKGVLEG